MTRSSQRAQLPGWPAVARHPRGRFSEERGDTLRSWLRTARDAGDPVPWRFFTDREPAAVVATVRVPAIKARAARALLRRL